MSEYKKRLNNLKKTVDTIVFRVIIDETFGAMGARNKLKQLRKVENSQMNTSIQQRKSVARTWCLFTTSLSALASALFHAYDRGIVEPNSVHASLASEIKLR